MKNVKIVCYLCRECFLIKARSMTDIHITVN